MTVSVKELSLSARAWVGRLLANIRAATAQIFSFAPRRVIALDLAIAIAVGVGFAVFALHQFHQYEFERLCRGFDLWFDSDPARTIANITSRFSPFHYRSSLHPVWALFFATPLLGLNQLFTLTYTQMTEIYVAMASSTLGFSLYIALRSFRLARLDALIGVVLFLSTSAAVFWIGLPEWVAFGAASAVLSIAWFASPPQFKTHFTGVAQSVISGSMVITNWIFGMAAVMFARYPNPTLSWGFAYRVTRDAIVVLALLSCVQHYIYPAAGGYLDVWEQAQEVAANDPLDHVRTFFAHTLAAPDAATIEGVKTRPGFAMVTSVQGQPIASEPLALLVFALWIALWAIGVYTAVKEPAQRPVFFFILGGLGFFFLQHFVFGLESFLFTMQFASLMLFIAMWGARWKLKWVVRALALVLIAASFAHNVPKFQETVAFHNQVDESWLYNLNLDWVTDWTSVMACD